VVAEVWVEAARAAAARAVVGSGVVAMAVAVMEAGEMAVGGWGEVVMGEAARVVVVSAEVVVVVVAMAAAMVAAAPEVATEAGVAVARRAMSCRRRERRPLRHHPTQCSQCRSGHQHSHCWWRRRTQSRGSLAPRSGCSDQKAHRLAHRSQSL